MYDAMTSWLGVFFAAAGAGCSRLRSLGFCLLFGLVFCFSSGLVLCCLLLSAAAFFCYACLSLFVLGRCGC
jgi:hypothetical protein